MKKLVVVGATSLMAHSCARLWIESNEYSSAVLIGRNRDKLEEVAKDLQTRGGTALKVEIRTGDMLTAEGVEQLVNQACEGDLPDTVLIAHGYMPDQDVIDGSLAKCEEVLRVTGVSPSLFLQSFAMKLRGNSSARIAVIGSVAGDRGRASNYIYGASKAMIAAAASGLIQRFAMENGFGNLNRQARAHFHTDDRLHGKPENARSGRGCGEMHREGRQCRQEGDLRSVQVDIHHVHSQAPSLLHIQQGKAAQVKSLSDLISGRFFKFIVCGGISTLVNLLSRPLCSMIMPFALAVVVAYIIGSLVGFVLYKNVVYKSKGNTEGEIVRFIAVNAIGIVQTVLLAELFLWILALIWDNPDYRSTEEFIAHFCALSVLTVTSYLLHLFITFRKTAK